MYPEKLLIPIYEKILQLSWGRGEHSLAKLDTFIFPFPRKITIGINNDIGIIIPPDPHFFRYLIKSHETHISNAISKLVNKGDIVVDIGANIGYFSAHAAVAVGKEGQVFCFEPEANNFEYLKVNSELIQKRGFNCLALKLAASSASGTATLNIHRYSTYHSLEDEHHLDKIEGTQVINTVTLDQWSNARGLRRISLIKIDTEGHEHKVLQGAIKLFEAKAVNLVILECRSEHLANFIDDFCKNLGLHQLVFDGKKWHKDNLKYFGYKTECLISLQPISPQLLC